MEPEIQPILAISAQDHDSELLNLWLHGRSDHTQRAYRADIGSFEAFAAGKPLAFVTLGDLQAFANSLTTAPASRYRTLSAIKSLLAFGHRVGYLRYDVGRALKLPPVRARLAERILTEADMHRMLAMEDDPRNRAILALLYASGIRVAELCGLSWRDVTAAGDAGHITVLGKGDKERTIHLPGSVWQMLAAIRPEAPAPDDAAFASRKGGDHLEPFAVHRIVRAAAKRAGIDAPVSPHWFRHAHASHALDHGAPIHLVQATLGHANVSTTGKYLHAKPKESSGRFLPL